MTKENLVNELKQFIIDTLDLDDIELSDIDENKPIFSEELGLTSIDLLELAVAIEKSYKVKIGNREVAEVAFKDLNALADFIISNTN